MNNKKSPFEDTKINIKRNIEKLLDLEISPDPEEIDRMHMLHGDVDMITVVRNYIDLFYEAHQKEELMKQPCITEAASVPAPVVSPVATKKEEKAVRPDGSENDVPLEDCKVPMDDRAPSAFDFERLEDDYIPQDADMDPAEFPPDFEINEAYGPDADYWAGQEDDMIEYDDDIMGP